VTVIEAEPNRVTQVRVPETDGYSAIQVTVGSKKSSRVNKPLAGHYAKAGVEAGRGLWEFRLDDHSGDVPAVGAEIDATIFEAGQKVDVRGISTGKGFQGGVKRHNFRTQDATHGNSLSHRAPGSIGQCQTPGRVFKGKKMAGHMGDARVTAQSIEVVRIDPSRNLILVKGAVPGARGGDVVITPAIKLKNKG
jgi:large subunit ribosomal protein L3